MKMLIPVGHKVPTPQAKEVITVEKKTAMLTKAKSLLNKPMSIKDMMNKLEYYYTRTENKHYTNKELYVVAEALYADINKCSKCGKYPCECVEEPIKEKIVEIKKG